MQTYRLTRDRSAIYLGAALLITIAALLTFVARADAWKPVMTATCADVTLTNKEGTIAHVVGDIATTIPPHGEITVAGPAKAHIVTSWWWENSAEPPIAGIVDRPGNCGGTTTTTATTAPTTSTSAPCEEDEPCWDCATMGNHICGTTTTVASTTTTVVVPTTVVTTPPSTPPPTVPPTSAAPTTAIATTTTGAPTTAAPTTAAPVASSAPAPTAAPVQQTASTASPAVVKADALPVTGDTPWGKIAIGVALVVAGALLVWGARRRAIHFG